jgi:multidrug efflux pump subunit AcrA (membrane-fusion protein)
VRRPAPAWRTGRIAAWTLAAAAALGAAGCGREPAEAPRATAPVVRGVHLVPAETAALADGVEAVGTVRSRTQRLLAAKVQGYVLEVHAREGDRVEPGRVLVTIDPREYAARVDRARAALAEASMSLEEARRAGEEAAAQHRSAEAEQRYAEAAEQRFRRLYQKELVAAQDWEATDLRRRAAQAAVEAARARIESVGARQSQMRERMAQARAELEVAEIALGDTRVAAPADGVVVERRVEPGNLAMPGPALLVLDDPRYYRLEAVVPESAVSGLRLGQSLPVTLDALGRTVAGRVAELVPAADPATRTVTVKLDLPEGTPVRSGLFGRVRLPGAERRAVMVPVAAVTERGQLTGVFVVDEGGAARLRLVTLGARQGERVEVLSGLAAGERVAAPVPTGLADGARVEAAP